MNNKKVKLNLKPIYNKNSKILILGSMPSITSRNNNFYYAHKYNRFWKIINIIFKTNLYTNEDKKLFLLNNNIALYDIIKECEITNSSDSTIKNIKLTNIEFIIKNSKIKNVFCLGKLTYKLFDKNFSCLNIPFFYLPSPSSANATYSLNKLVENYKIIINILKK